jgi:hypothetical protein
MSQLLGMDSQTFLYYSKVFTPLYHIVKSSQNGKLKIDLESIDYIHSIVQDRDSAERT